MSILTFIIALPLVAALLLCLVPGSYRFVMRLVAAVVTFIVMLLAIKMFWQFNHAPADAYGFKFLHEIKWWGIDSDALKLHFHYFVGVDGINVGLILMGAIVAFAAALCSWDIRDREKEYYILLLVMTGGILGAFASLDLFFFYFFHELALVP